MVKTFWRWVAIAGGTVPALKSPPHTILAEQRLKKVAAQKMKPRSRAVTMQHHAHRKGRHPTA